LPLPLRPPLLQLVLEQRALQFSITTVTIVDGIVVVVKIAIACVNIADVVAASALFAGLVSIFAICVFVTVVALVVLAGCGAALFHKQNCSCCRGLTLILKN